MSKILFLLLMIQTVLFAQSELGCSYNTIDFNANSTLILNNWKYHFGETGNGADTSFVDSAWQKINRFNFNKDSAGIYWFRTNIKFVGEINPEKDIMVWVSKLPSAFEVYWDGKLIGSNGKVANSREEEIPGNYIFYKKISNDLLNGKNHILAIRVSNFHGELLFGGNASFFTIVGYYSDWFGPYEISINRHYFSIGFLLITSILCFSLFIAVARNMSFLFLGIFCFIEISFHLSFILVNLKLINILYVDYIYFSRNISYFFECFLVNSFLIFKYKIPKKYIHLTLTILITIISEILFKFQFVNIPFHQFMLYGYATGLLIYSAYLKKTGSIVTLIGVSILFMLNILNVSIMAFNIFGLVRLPFLITEAAYIIFISSIIFAAAEQIRKQNQEHENSRNLSQRLEMELLKRNIKPHFILNTLFSVISLIRKEPQKAIKMIQALADEFQIINRISSKKLIPIKEEIELCEKHLNIMEFRKNASYKLNTHNLNSRDQIPPMIFHTLIENGITHSFKIGENGIFNLFVKKNGDGIEYIFQNEGSKLKTQKTRLPIKEGTGLRYIKARLTESYNQNWNMQYGMNNGFWEVKINIRK